MLYGGELPTGSGLLPYRAISLWQQSYTYVAPVDADGDTVDEFLALLGDRGVQLYDHSLLAVSGSLHLPDGSLRGSSRCGGIDGDHLWFSHLRNDTLLLRALWSGRDMPVATGKDLNGDSIWEGTAQAVQLADLDGDGRMEAIVAVSVGFDLRPRGVYVIDWQTGRLEGHFETGPVVPQFVIRDIDGDGNSEILCGTSAVGNRNSANGLHDWLSYVFALDHRGSLLWLDTVGRYASQVLVDTIRAAPKGDLLLLAVEAGHPAGGRTADRVLILDPRNGEVLRETEFGTFNISGCVVHSSRGRSAIALNGTDDTLRLLDEELELQDKRYVPACTDWRAATPFRLRPGGDEYLALGSIDGCWLRLNCPDSAK
jgi:hypothetical protein